MKRWTLFKALAFLLVLLLGIQFANAQTTAQRRSASLGKGMNFSLWLEDYYSFYLSNTELNYPEVGRFTEAYVDSFKKLGFQSIRLPVLFEGFVPEPPTAPYNFDLSNPNVVAGLNYVDSAIKWCSKYQMILVIDNHIADDDAVDDNLQEDYGITNSNYTMQAALIASVWKQAIARYEYSNPDSVIFEIRNEPNVVSDANLVSLYQTVIDTIRKHDTTHTLVVGTSGYYDPYELASLTPYSDTNIIYTTHIYNGDLSAYPGFCFQGNGGVAATDTASGQRTALVPYGLTGPNDADAIEIAKEINTVATWGTTNNKPVWLSEFGSTTLPDVYHDDTSRCNYFETVSTAVKAANMPWAYWNGYGPEGLYTSYDGGTTLSYFFSVFDATNIINAAHMKSCFAQDFDLGTYAPLTWTAGVSTTDWFTAGNWSNDAVPTSTANLTIPAASITANISPVIPSGNASVNSLTLNSGASLTISSGANLDVYGNLTNNGTASLGSGTINFEGAAAQTIYGTSAMTNVEMDNSNGVTIDPSGSVSVSDVLTLKTGTLTTNSNLTLTSTSTSQVAMIDNFSGGNTGTISGSIVAERYYAASETYNQHFMGSPVDAPALTQFGASGTSGYITPLVDCDETQLLSGSPASNVYAMVESAPGAAECGLAEWDALTSGNAVDGEGYSVYLVGAGTLSLTGPPNLNSSYSLPGLTNSNWESTTLQGRNVGSGWHLLSNPYSATLNISSNGGSGFDNQVQVWITEGGNARTYQMYTPGSNATVSAFQGFMVHVTTPGTTPTYTFNGSDRSLTAATFSRVADESELVVKATNTGTGLTDYTTVAFNSDATPAFDPQYDGNKLAGSLTRHTLYTTIADGQWMALNTLPSVAQAGEVPMGFEPGVDGNYTLSFAGLTSFDANTTIMLQDKLTNTLYNVQNGDYKFTAKATDDWNRFNLIFSTASTTGITTVTGDNNIPVWSYQNKVNVDFSQLKDVKANVTIYDLLGQEITSENYEGNNIYTKTLDNVDAAFLIVKVVNGDQVVTKKVFITNAK